MGFKAKASDAPVDEERERAVTASHDCAICGGEGLVTVYHPTFAGDPIGVTGDGRRYPTIMGAHCRCEFGSGCEAATRPRLQARIPWVEDIMCRRSRWLLEPPSNIPLNHPDGPDCPRCTQPMHGGRGGLPWECYGFCG